MKIFIIDDENNSRIEIPVEDKNITTFANILEHSDIVKQFYIDSLNVSNQPKYYNCKGYTKWKSVVG